MLVTLAQVAPLLPLHWKAGVTPFLHSSPGIGKSSLGHQIAKKQRLMPVDIRLTDMEPSDFNGLPFRAGSFADFLPFKMFPLEGAELPEGYDGWLIILDEFNSASDAVQSAAYKFVLDHMVGQTKLHPKVFKMACGNLESDNAIVNPMSSALISRFAHYYIKLDYKGFMEWAAGELDIRVTSFLGAFPDNLYSFTADADSPYSCPRTWHMLSNTIQGLKIESFHVPLLASYVGDGIAAEFKSFLELYAELPSIEAILKDPEGISLSGKLGVRWALMGMVIHHINETNSDKAVIFLKRLSLELQVCALREIRIRHPVLVRHENLRDWRLELAKVVYE